MVTWNKIIGKKIYNAETYMMQKYRILKRQQTFYCFDFQYNSSRIVCLFFWGIYEES